MAAHNYPPKEGFSEIVYPGVDWFDNLRRFNHRSTARDDLDNHKKLIEWCHENLALCSFAEDGITRFSFRYYFKNADDATAFRLKFGI